MSWKIFRDPCTRCVDFFRSEPLFSLLLIGTILAALFEGQRLSANFSKYLDLPALSAITAFFITSYLLECSGFFSAIATALTRPRKGISPSLVPAGLVLMTEAAAALMMNDAAMFIAVPLAVAVARVSGSDEKKLVVGVTLAANIGSSLTPNGNPQNIIIWMKWRVAYWVFVYSMAPYVLLWSLILVAYIFASSGKYVAGEAPPPISLRKRVALIALGLLAANIVFVEKGLWIEALAVSLIVAAAVEPKVLLKFDYMLLATFALMFLFFNAISSLLIVPSLRGLGLIVVAALLSQVISNVPATLLLSSRTLEWLPLAIGVNLGGLGTVIGSMANFIGVRLSPVTVEEFHKCVIPLFLVFVFATLALYVASTI